MADIISNIKLGIAQTGANALRAITNQNAIVGGTVAKAVDTVGRTLGNPLPDVKATEQAESAGGYQIAQTNPALAQSMVEKRSTELKIPTSSLQTTPTQPASSTNSTPTPKEYTTQQLAQLGVKEGDMWNTNEVTINGVKYRINDTGRGTRTLTQVVDNPGGGDGGGDKLSADEMLKMAQDKGQGFLSQNDFDELMKKYGDTSRSNADALGAEIERKARENAEREYNDVKNALGVQREEVGRMGEQNRKRVQEEKELGTQELIDKEDTEQKNIEKQKAGFLNEVAETSDTLARNWRDMSLEVQRIMRARGTSDSSYSGDKEGSVLLEFNRGLRSLAKSSTQAVADFAEAAVETNKFYTREKNKLEIEARKSMEDIDTWMRQTIQGIQAQENKALTQKLNEINNAITQAKTLRIQTEQSIADKQFGIDSWLIQTQMNYKNAVSLAGKGKQEDAAKTIASYRDLAKEAYDLVTKGGYEFQVVKGEDGKSQAVIHGQLPNGQDDYIYLTPGGFDTLTQNVYGSLTKSNDPYGLGSSTTIDPTSINQARSQAGLPAVGGDKPATTQQSGGLMSTIKNFFN